jgi:hypothetical protein
MRKLLAEVKFQNIQGFGRKLGNRIADLGNFETPKDVTDNLSQTRLKQLFGAEVFDSFSDFVNFIVFMVVVVIDAAFVATVLARRDFEAMCWSWQ